MKKVRRQNDTAQTRSAIEAEAAKMIDAGGVNALSISKIAETLQMTHSNVYRHFPSKSALAAEIAVSWMSEMREACEAAVARKRSVRSRLLALVLAIREQLLRRANHPDPFSIFHFVLEHKPAEAIAHHIHRRALVVEIMVGAGWPRDQVTEQRALTILDGLRFFTDPHAMAAHKDADLTDRIENVVEMLGDYIERRPKK